MSYPQQPSAAPAQAQQPAYAPPAQQPYPGQQPWGQQPHAAPQAQPYGTPPQAQPYGAPQGQPYAAPQAQPYGTPPQAQPYGAPQGQPYAAPQVQPYAAPQAQPYAAPAQPGLPQGQPYPAAGQPGAPQGQPYPAAGQPGAPQGQPHPAAGQPGAPEAQPYPQLAVTACRMCGSVPAAPVKFRGHQGFVVMMRFLSLDGPFCRDCGLSTFRSMTSRTLVQGWYGYASFIITPITVLMNIARRGKVANLPAPQPNPYGPSRQPMDPGPRLLQRPMTIVGLGIPFALIILIVVVASLNS